MDDEIDLDWPHDPTEIIKEALRNYVGDADGVDEDVLAKHDREVAIQTLRDAALDMERRTFAILRNRDEIATRRWMNARADRIAAGEDV